MSPRKIRRIAIVLAVSAMASLPPAHAREIGWRGFDRIARSLGSFHHVLGRLFDFARGGMDPNGNS